MKTYRILILEDDLKTLEILMGKLATLEDALYPKDLAVTVLAEYTQVEEYVNKKEAEDFDIILLDRDCKACGSFHVLDFEKFGTDKIISISSTPQWNEDAKKRGVKRIIRKDFEKIEEFADKVVEEIKKMILCQKLI